MSTGYFLVKEVILYKSDTIIFKCRINVWIGIGSNVSFVACLTDDTTYSLYDDNV